ncbi:hypothetical protein I8H89_00315 [Candidatus Saccharibacteria bacterium]|nr:hypothetical protein [Candidatus Saccharibacteria bacterium]
MKREQKQNNILAIIFAIAVPIFGIYAAVATYFAVDLYGKQEQASSQLKMIDERTATIGSVLDAVNAERAKNGIAPLVSHPNLQKSAQLKADDMTIKGYRQHNLPGTNSMYSDDMQALVNQQCKSSSENYVYDKKGEDMTTSEALNWWLGSKSHREALLDSSYTYTGIGISKGGVIVQHFCVAS